MLELCGLRLEALAKIPEDTNLPFACPLEVHCRYSREEVLAALGYWKDTGKLRTSREGIVHLPEKSCDVFFVTLNKTEKHYSPSTMYRDYAIDERLFHWQSQSTTSLASKTGKRYLNQRKEGATVLLFVRENKTGLDGLASPFVFLGPMDYVSHEGEKPISIVWELRHSIPAALLPKTRRLAV